VSHLLEALADLDAQDAFKGVVLHRDHVDGSQFALGDGDDEFHADEGAADDNETLSLLELYEKDNV